VNAAVVYISTASEQSDPVKRRTALENAQRNLLEAMDRGQEDNPAVWYFLGRYYVMTSDLVGADSAFDRAVADAPDCEEDIKYYRQVLWVPAMNRAMDSMRVGAYEGAKVVLSQSHAVWDQDNLAPYYLARIFGNQGELDSAVHYFKEVVAFGTADSSRLENYQESVFNVAVVYRMLQQWDSTAAWYDRYRTEVDPNDPQALTGLAEALKEGGAMAQDQGDSARGEALTDRAMMMYDTIMARAPDMEALDLFQVGEKLFLAEEFEKSARAFDLGLEKSPFFRPGLYNLANAYLAICNDDEKPKAAKDSAARAMEAVGRRLVAVDPLNSESLNLLAAAFQLQRMDDSTLAILELREAMTFEVKIDVQQPTDEGFLVQGRLTNPKEAEVAVPGIEFEFLDVEGNVLSTEMVEPTTLDPMGSSTFYLTGTAEGIAAVRYKAAP
jgi:tetratricopeptide (TPR) repeat protein